jgi:hypothetical protein
MKKFHIGDILSVVTHKSLFLRGMDDVRETLNYMTNCDLQDLHLPDAFDKCRPILLDLYPDLATVDSGNISHETFPDWLICQEAKYGEKREVPTLAEAAH